MGYIINLWHAFLVLHPWGYVSPAVVLLIAFVKGKAISAGASAAWKRVDSWFTERLRTKLGVNPQTAQVGQTRFMTYRGSFQDYYYKSIPLPSHFFKIISESDGSLLTVEVLDTDLLLGIKRGTLVQIETEATVGAYPEIVKRVRKF